MEWELPHGVHSKLKGAGSRKIKQALEQWIENHKDYCWTDDSLYFYNEMANVSVLSAAFWQVGGQSLCEFQLTKKNEDKEDKPGRSDLWFRVSGYHYWAEAKHRWPSLKPNKKIEEHFQDYREAVHKAVEGLSTRELSGENKLGLLFLTPHISGNDKSEARDATRSFLRSLQQEYTSWELCAYYFPNGFPYSPKYDKQYPGVCLLGRHY